MKKQSKHNKQRQCPHLRQIMEGNPPSESHLSGCEACRELMGLVNALHISPDEIIEEPCAGALDRHLVVPELLDVAPDVERLAGSVVFDSWQQLPARELRSPGRGTLRRLCLAVGDITLEIVAERLRGVWDLTARVYEGGEPSLRWKLVAGRRTLLPGAMGFYHWGSGGVPHRFRLLTSKHNVTFEKISWQMLPTS